MCVRIELITFLLKPAQKITRVRELVLAAVGPFLLPALIEAK